MTISINPRRRCTGMTLPEVLIGSAVGVLVLGAAMGLLMFANKSFAMQFNYVDMSSEAQAAVDRLSQQVRQTRALASFSSNQLDFIDFDGKHLTITYSPNERVLRQTKDDISKVLLEGCDALSFAMFRRTAQFGTDAFYPTTDPSACRIIQLQWDSSRTILGRKLTTDSMQTARVVLRNH